MDDCGQSHIHLRLLGYTYVKRGVVLFNKVPCLFDLLFHDKPAGARARGGLDVADCVCERLIIADVDSRETPAVPGPDTANLIAVVVIIVRVVAVVVIVRSKAKGDHGTAEMPAVAEEATMVAKPTAYGSMAELHPTIAAEPGSPAPELTPGPTAARNEIRAPTATCGETRPTAARGEARTAATRSEARPAATRSEARAAPAAHVSTKAAPATVHSHAAAVTAAAAAMTTSLRARRRDSGCRNQDCRCTNRHQDSFHVTPPRAPPCAI